MKGKDATTINIQKGEFTVGAVSAADSIKSKIMQRITEPPGYCLVNIVFPIGTVGFMRRFPKNPIIIIAKKHPCKPMAYVVPLDLTAMTGNDLIKPVGQSIFLISPLIG